MIEVVREIPVRRPADEVLEYLADFAHAAEWDPGTEQCVRIDASGSAGAGASGSAGAPEPGARWRNVSVFRGRRTELVYELVDRGPDQLLFVGRNRTVTASDEITVSPAPDGAGSVVRYRARLRFHGLARLAEPFLRRDFERLADAARRRMPEVLDGG
ncbi:polyketide cyclase/dehydrase/lipid transport protein [Kitasatospora sp. SolWspMP-SS2h]|uniref:SRPBCC family protein n=1 Tax=Kitasatospora sp. SolWspMP-SS2h TaxID=1305729 RepID=UPI000DB9DCB9|nr:SRPBCC family protein [Kitasatospora sp. SolWspMP-SS2h]RAJ45556.1 polyketide cyclase/dehydrase/lipid transport protein [Kitasatospora sp. SolWspMP-SS2h]